MSTARVDPHACPTAQAPGTPALLTVEVAAASGPHQVHRVSLQLPLGSTVARALVASGLLPQLGLASPVVDDAGQEGAADEPLDLGEWAVAVWGRLCHPGLTLRDRDRVELVRGLRVDPKEARRQRYKGKPPRRTVTGSPPR